MTRPTFDLLLEHARKRTGLQDFGDERATSAARLLMESFERESRASAAGGRIFRTNMMRLLGNRLRLVKFWSSASMSHSAVRRPIVIFGLPRTGSTFLQHLFGLDPRLRALRRWETAAPVPPPGVDPEADEERREWARQELGLSGIFSPQVRELHPSSTDSPVECMALLRYSFASHTFDAIGPMSSYATWYRDADLSWAYEEFGKTLALWASACPGVRTWLLKAPPHLFHLAETVGVLGEPRLVQTHRDPADVFESGARLLFALRKTYGTATDLEACLDETSEDWSIGMQRCLQWRDRTGYPVSDVSFRELTREPLRTMRRLYGELGLDWSEADEARVGAALDSGLDESMKARHHDPVSFPAGFAERFESYRGQFGHLF